jgi:photosystem II stability/assembly factor-like uncharacterized protein
MKLTITGPVTVLAAAVAVTGAAVGPGLAAHASPVTAHSARSQAVSCRTSPASPGIGLAGSLAGVQFVSSTTGWVVGSNRVLATTDSGAHWRTQLHRSGRDLSAVDAIDPRHVWVFGPTIALASANGGRTWRRLSEPCQGSISSLHFVSPTKGFAVAGGTLVATRNAGRSWHAQTSPAAAQSVCFTSPRRGWLGAHGRIYRTTTAGRHWTLAVTSAHSHARRAYPIAEVQCAGRHAGWAELIGPGVGASQEEHVAYSLNDAGSRGIFGEQYFQGAHSTIKRPSPGAYFAAFSSVDASTAVFVDTCAPCGLGTSPVDVATGSGRTLTKAGRVGNLNYATGASYVSATDGWVVGSRNRLEGRPTWKIEHTVDGRHWVTQYAE